MDGVERVKSTAKRELRSVEESKLKVIDFVEHILEKKLSKLRTANDELQRHDQTSDSFINTYSIFEDDLKEMNKLCNLIPLFLNKFVPREETVSREIPVENRVNSPPRPENSAKDSQSKKVNQKSTEKKLALDELLPKNDLGKQFKGFLVHLEGPNQIYCAPRNMLSKYDELAEKLKKFQTRERLNLRDLALPTLALVPSKKYPGSIFRAFVMSKDAVNKTCTVMFADWGDQEIARMDEVYKIPPAFCLLPPVVKIELTYSSGGIRIPNEQLLPERKTTKELLKKHLIAKRIDVIVFAEKYKSSQNDLNKFTTAWEITTGSTDPFSGVSGRKNEEQPQKPGDAFGVYASVEGVSVLEAIAEQLKLRCGGDGAKSSHVQTSLNSGRQTKSSTSVKTPFYGFEAPEENVDEIHKLEEIEASKKLDTFLQKSNFGIAALQSAYLNPDDEPPMLPDEDVVSCRPQSPVGSDITSVSQREARRPFVFGNNFG